MEFGKGKIETSRRSLSTNHYAPFFDILSKIREYVSVSTSVFSLQSPVLCKRTDGWRWEGQGKEVWQYVILELYGKCCVIQCLTTTWVRWCQRQSYQTVYRLCIADHKQHNLSHSSGFSQSSATPTMRGEWSLNYTVVPSGSHAIPWLFIILKQDS